MKPAGPLWSGDTAEHRERVHRIATMPRELCPPADFTRERIALHAAEAEAREAREGTKAEKAARDRARLDAFLAEKAEREAEALAPFNPAPAPDLEHDDEHQAHDQLTLGG